MERKDTILLINDSPDQQELMSTLLSMAGYRIQTAGDGREGLDVARQERPSLVISDVVMPRGDGIELCRAIRAEGGLHSTPILLLSAERVDTKSAVEGLEAGADDYLEVPFDPMRLVAKVARLVERSRSEAALRESEERFRVLVEGVRDYAIFMLDTEGRATSWNAGVKRVLGYEGQ